MTKASEQTEKPVSEASEAAKTRAEKRLALPVDPKGFVTIQNGDVEAKVLPESVRAWEAHGWEVVADGPTLVDGTDTTDPFVTVIGDANLTPEG